MLLYVVLEPRLADATRTPSTSRSPHPGGLPGSLPEWRGDGGARTARASRGTADGGHVSSGHKGEFHLAANAASKDLDRTALGFLSVFEVPSELRLHLFDFTSSCLLYWTRIATTNSSGSHCGHPVSAQHRH